MLSPKFQNQLVIVPVELSVKDTVSGQLPDVGLAVKAAARGPVPTPVTALVEFPPLDVKTTTLLKLETVEGLNATETCPVCPAPRLKGLPLTMLNGKVVVAVPLRVWPPLLTTWNAATLVWPTPALPRLRFA